MARPWEMNWGQPQPSATPSVIPLPQSRSQQVDETLRIKAAQREEQARADAAAKAERERREWEATHNPDGSPIPQPTAADSRALGGDQRRAKTINSFIGEVRRLYEQDIKGQPASRLFGATEYIDAIPRNERFTAAANNILPLIRPLVAQTAKEGDSDKEMEVFLSYIPNNNDSDITIEQKLKQLEMLIGGMVDGRPPSETANSLTRHDAPPGILPPGAGGQMGGNQPGGQPPAPVRPWSPDDPRNHAATGGTQTVEDNPALAAEYRARLASQSDAEILGWLRSQRVSPQTMMQAMAQLKYRKENPNVPVESYSITSTREEPLSLYDRAANAAGNYELPGGFSPGAYAVGAGQFLSGNTLDNLSGNSQRAQVATDIMRTSNPGSTFAGEMTGGILGTMGGEAALARLGMAPGFLRGLAADVSMGAANGAGMADNGNRLLGAAQGAAAAGVGSALGAGAMKAAGAALRPLGGELRPLYDAGVMPTPGQRFANSGTAGRILNTVEEGLQSVPIVGQAIRGARQEARDQFQIGAFNEALGEIGEQLPKGMKPGTDPHAFAQRAFNRVYEQARSSMRLVADEELSNQLGQLAPDISTLGPAARGKLKRIMQNSVNNRLANVNVGDIVTGEMSGASYKKAMADLGRHSGRLRNSPMAEDQALADVLDGVRGALDSAARRHSDPAAVQLLDAADAGYAKLVRIEDAAARRGGGAGVFSPANFDSAVQRTSGGVRSKAYSRGDALMQDYAKAGRSLEDTLPNSGTADRAAIQIAAGGALGGGAATGFIPPAALAALGAIGGAYAPGVRRMTKGILAPPGPVRSAIARQLEKRARLLGRVGAASAAAALPGTSASR